MTVGRRRALIAMVVLITLGFGSVLGVGLYLAAPRPAVLGLPPGSLAGAEMVQFASASGSVLHGWYLPPAREGGGAVVLMHGYRSNRGVMAARAAFLHSRGFGALLFDFQAEGESPGQHITFGFLEGMDAVAAVAFVRGRAPGELVAAIGVSLGGAAVTLAPEPLAVDAVVLESVFPTLDSALRNRLAMYLPHVQAPVAVPVLAPLMEALMPPILGVGVQEVAPIVGIKRVRAPLLVIAGDQDDRTTIAEGRALYTAAPEPKQFWEVAGAGHVDLEKLDQAAYWAKVLPFLTAHLQRGTP